MYVFYGKENYHHLGYHPHESYGYVIAAMSPLAILAIVAGWFQAEFVAFVTTSLPMWESHLDLNTHYMLVGITSAIAVSGVAFAVFKYLKSGTYLSGAMHKRFCYKLLANQYYIPHFWDKVVVKPYYKLSMYSWKQIDMKIIDAIVDGIAKLIYTGGEEGRVIQTGNLSKALKLMVGGIFILLTLILFFGLTK